MTASVAQLRSDAPRVPSDVIARPRLVAALENDSPLTLVRGASGTGKTVALAEWAHTTPSIAVWVDVDASAATSVDLARDVMRAMERRGLGSFTGDTSDRPWRAVQEALRAAPQPIVLVLDDAAALTRESVFDVCRVVAAAGRARVIAATNRRSPFDGDGLDLVIDRRVVAPDELMFDGDEIARALGVDATTASEILASTGGFPAVIHAAARRSLPVKEETLLDDAATAVEEYMRARIEHSGFDPKALEALVKMSVSDALDLQLARTLTGVTDVAGILDDAEAFGFGRWSTSGDRIFTFAPVARVLLRRELHRSHLDETPRLKREAIHSALHRRSPFEALRLAIEQDDLALATHVIMTGWTHLLDNDGKAVVKLLGQLPVSRLKDEPLVAMLLAICYLASRLRRIRGLQLLRVAIAAANSRRSGLSAPERLFIWTAESAALRLIGMMDRASHVATRALTLFSSTPESDWEAYAAEVPLLYTQLGLSLYYGGRRPQALECFDYAASLAASHEIQNAFHSVCLLSGIHALNGDMPEARYYVDLVREGPWDESFRDGYRGTFYRVAEAILAVEAGDTASAREHVSVFGPHRSTSEHWATMGVVEGWVALHEGDPAAGLEQLESLTRSRGREAGATHARHTLSRPRTLLHLALGDTRSAKDTLQRDAQSDRFGTVLERARLAMLEGRASDASRMLAQTRLEPESARERAERAAVLSAALLHTAGAAAAAKSAEALSIQLADRDLVTPVSLLDPEDFSFLRDLVGERGVDTSSVTALLPSMSTRPQLSSREKVVLRALTSGASLQSIAADLNVSQNTLKTQLRSIYRKLEAKNRSDAVEKAIGYSLLSEQ
ncbi:helix-turn-helix transcriptional regulator [Microbacterium sp. SA39]|uniref:helix-turn-helix transcriptional regulator n=1 Tax=Microbacterium sp. SA39 TaxID=1263625 RepID=UPI00061F87A7|nr:LuxR C-terminal-related transcriptional regulator [Microbacterium sp. SA39]KJQ54302.1 HTH-type transcriptional regulator MalT [Microbacterium sp. SA39]